MPVFRHKKARKRKVKIRATARSERKTVSWRDILSKISDKKAVEEKLVAKVMPRPGYNPPLLVRFRPPMPYPAQF